MDYSKLQISENATILDALTKLNELRNMSRLVLLVVSKGKVMGTVTDGDIRRALAQGSNLNKKIVFVCNQNFVFAEEKEGFLDLSVYKKKNIKILPILNKDKTLSRILDLCKIKSLLPLECVIMAGGRGKRLSPLTDTAPKPMLPLGKKPIIEYNIDRLISYGVNKIYISVRYLGEQIEKYFGDGSSKGISIEYIWEDKPLGTAGSLSLVDNYSTDQVLLMNSDLFTNVNFEEMYLDFINHKADMVVASTEYKVDVPYAVFETNNNQVTAFKEKPSYLYHSNAGIYLIKKDLISKIPKDTFYDITDFMDDLVDEGGKLIHIPIKGYWIDIGKPIDYKNAQEFIKHFEQ